MTQTTETKVFLALETGRWYVSATGAPTAEVAQGHALCDCGAKLRLEDVTGPSGPTQSRLSGLEYALHYAGEHG